MSCDRTRTARRACRGGAGLSLSGALPPTLSGYLNGGLRPFAVPGAVELPAGPVRVNELGFRLTAFRELERLLAERVVGRTGSPPSHLFALARSATAGSAW